MARSVRKNSNSNSNRRTNRNSNKNIKKNKRSQNRSQRKNRGSRRNRSQRQNKSQRRNKNKKGGALPAYRLHQEQGFLNRINPNAHSLPLTYEGDHVVENHSNQYSISH